MDVLGIIIVFVIPLFIAVGIKICVENYFNKRK
jgi:hypothetical protein